MTRMTYNTILAVPLDVLPCIHIFDLRCCSSTCLVARPNSYHITVSS